MATLTLARSAFNLNGMNRISLLQLRQVPDNRLQLIFFFFEGLYF